MYGIRFLLIGCGFHSRRIHVPLIIQHPDCELLGVVDLQHKRNDVQDFLKSQNFDFVQTLFLPISISSTCLEDIYQKQLSDMVKSLRINAVIISVEPCSHRVYAQWALDENLHILLDKPITSQLNASTNERQAEQILADYDYLARSYSNRLKNRHIVFSCMAQRRFHPAINYIWDCLKEVSDITSCPITSISMFHSDGQWRFPPEIVHESYHGYNHGIGKCSHSGYHFFDLLSWFLKATMNGSKTVDSVKVYAEFVRPSDFIYQIQEMDYVRLFDDQYYEYKESFPAYSLDIFEKMGEIDANIAFTFLSEGRKVTLANLLLVHNGFSKRSWVVAKPNLYKGNGRVRHEHYIIEQGPFQSIHYHSYQSGEVLEREVSLTDVGGELHSEVYVFRNSKVIGGVDFSKVNFGAKTPNNLAGYSRGHQEEARKNCFDEFVNNIKVKKLSGDQTSNILSHREGVILMTGTYLSAAQAYTSNNPHVLLPYKGLDEL